MSELTPDIFVGNDRQEPKIPFVETLPEGEPTLSLTRDKFPDSFVGAIGEMSEYSPLDYLRLLKFFPPEERVRVLGLTKWDRLAESISHVKEDSECSLIAKEAREALGVDNVRNLAFNFTKRSRSREHQKAAIRLAGGLPLADVSSIFAQYANIARAGIEWPMEGDDAWIDLFYAGAHTLYICAMANKDSGVTPPEDTTRIISQIIDEDMSTIAKRIKKPTEALGGVYMLKKIRDCITEPASIDKLMSFFGYKFDEAQKDYVKE
jgi:hypothetical protein